MYDSTKCLIIYPCKYCILKYVLCSIWCIQWRCKPFY